MPRRKKNGNRNSNGSISAVGILYLLKHLGRPFMEHGGKGQPIIELQRNGIGAASLAVWDNVKDLDITGPVIDGIKIGAVRKLGLGVTVMKVGKTAIRSV